MDENLAATPAPDLGGPLALAFRPLHKRAFGIAVGLAAGLVLALATLVTLLRDGGDQINLGLLAQYLYGYRVSGAGVLVGFAWGFFIGFVAGWFTAFSRNLVMATSLFLVRTRAELTATRDFLDHI